MLTKDEIRAIFLSAGFTIKDGQDDLKPYVYEAANKLIDAHIKKCRALLHDSFTYRYLGPPPFDTLKHSQTVPAEYVDKREFEALRREVEDLRDQISRINRIRGGVRPDGVRFKL